MRFLWIYTLFLPFTATAQYDAILADTSVSWAGIFEMTLPANPLNYSEEESWQNLADLVVLKLQSDDTGLSGYFDYSFNTPMWKRLERPDWKYFADADLTRPLACDEVLRIIGAPDTVTTFDPETFQEKIAIVWDAHFFPQECPLLKTRQILTYSNTPAKFGVVPLAIAPAQPDGSVQFWMQFPAENRHSNFDFNSPDIHWAIRFITRNTSPQSGDFKVIKGGEISLAERLFERLGKDTSIAIYVPNDLKKPASPGERDHIFRVQTDTVSIFNPTTYEEETTKVTAGYQPENIVDFQLTEEWIWDNKQQLPFVRLRAVAPRSRKTSSWHKTVFYLKTMD